MKKVLLVDDDNIFNYVSTKILEHTGVFNEIHTALNGEQALKLLNGYYGGASTLPDVILLDLNMPVMDGFGFLEAFKKVTLPRKDTVKIIVVSSSSDEKDIERAMHLGADDFLVKPLTETTLMEALKRLN